MHASATVCQVHNKIFRGALDVIPTLCISLKVHSIIALILVAKFLTRFQSISSQSSLQLQATNLLRCN